MLLKPGLGDWVLDWLDVTVGVEVSVGVTVAVGDNVGVDVKLAVSVDELVER